MKCSAAGIALIKRFEGYPPDGRPALQSYQDVVGIWTIGWGSTRGVHEKMSATYEQAELMLRRDLEPCEEAVNRLAHVPLTQNQFDALVSFTFNLGTGALASSNLLKVLNAGGRCASEFARWNHAGGKVVEGLTKRRLAEAGLFLTP